MAIIRSLQKWRADCLGMRVHVLTDHRTLENFDKQKDLSRCQLRWQEEISQFDLEIAYIPGDENVGADAISRIGAGMLPSDVEHPNLKSVSNIESWKANPFLCASVLSLSADKKFLDQIKLGYESDPFILKLIDGGSLVPNISHENGLWFVSGRLVIPNYLSLREDLFHLAHDTCGHFGADKSYAMLADSYYWPHMRRDLCKFYVPACEDCQRNKGRTAKNVKGPLHPLPIPEARCDSVGMDFIGPLPVDQGFDCILTMTDCLGSDLKIIPTNLDISAPALAKLVFDH